MSDLPRGWSRISLGEAAQVVMGQSPPGSSYNDSGDGVPFFQGKAEFTELVAQVRKFTTAGTKFAQAGDVLVSVRAPVGPTNLAPADCAIGRGLAALRARGDLDQRYLLWALRASESELAKHGAGSTFAAITGQQLRSHVVPVAPLRDQRRIVDLIEEHFSRLDAAEAQLRSVEVRLGSLRRQMLDRLFGQGPTTTLGDLVVDISAGKSFGSASAPADDDEWGIIKVSAMTRGVFDGSENKAVPADRVDPRYEIRPGDLLVSRANTSEYVGASVLVGDVRPRLLLSDKSLRVTPRDGVSSPWLWRAMQAPAARRQISALATGTKDSMRNISQASLRAVRVPQVDREGQAAALHHFASFDASLDRLVSAVAEQRTKVDSLRRSVLTAVFDGRFSGARTEIESTQHFARNGEQHGQ